MQGPIAKSDILLGCLVGDALGAPYIGIRGGHMQQVLGGRVDGYAPNFALFPDRPDQNRLPGLHSACGQQVLAVLAARAAAEQDIVAGAGRQLQELAGEHGTGALRHAGRPLRRAIDRWREEYPAVEENFYALREGSRGASAACWGVASYLADTDAPLARLTHDSQLSLAAAIAVRAALELMEALGRPGRRLDAAGFLQELIRVVGERESALCTERGKEWREAGDGEAPRNLAESLECLPSLLREGDDVLAEKTLVHQAGEFDPAHPVATVQNGFAPVLVPWILYKVLGAESVARSVEDVLNRGGETSLAAALVAALGVARHGIEALPSEWIDGLLAAPIARRLASDAAPGVAEEWVAKECAWVAEEERLRAPLVKAAAAEAEKRRAREGDRPKASTQEDSPFAPPPPSWLQGQNAEDPEVKKRLKVERSRRRIDWKEERHRKGREKGED